MPLAPSDRRAGDCECSAPILDLPATPKPARRSFAEPDYRAPGGESLNQTMQRAIAALSDIAAAGHRLAVVASHRNLTASVLRSMDAAFGFEQWQDLRTPDLLEVEPDAGRPIRFVRLDVLGRFEGQ